MKHLTLMLLTLAGLACSCTQNCKEESLTLIPEPAELTMHSGQFSLNNKTQIRYAGEESKAAAEYLQKEISRQTGLQPEISTTPAGKNEIFLQIAPELSNNDKYTLEVNKNGITLSGANPRSVMLGVQTIRQMIPLDSHGKSKVNLPAVHISDQPVWEWRGLHMDAARHFFDVDEVKQFLDLMAFYKFNKFHWHLTDDQGWRVEIKKYPLLTEIGAWRTYNNHDRGCMNLAQKEDNPDYQLPEKRLRTVGETTEYGGFYTQQQIKEVVAYAALLGIDVIPEIDMPGHFSAAILAYPELACFNQASWGKIFSAPICPGKDQTVEFCKEIYSEIFELFPYEYVHLGADEVEKDNWIKCPNCQARIRQEGLRDEKELQSWFVREMKAFFDANGKKLIGWDEIIEGGLTEGATVMWWRTWAQNAVKTATAKGSEVILTPNSHYYFDYQQNNSTLQKLYEFDPVPAGLSAEQRQLILGVQANHWAEWIPSFQRLQFMNVPRLLALSEVAWRPENDRNWEEFRTRLIRHFPRLDAMKINYRPLDLTGIHTVNAFVGKHEVNWKHPLPAIEIYYTTDGSMPTRESKRYNGPFIVSETTDFTLRFYRPDKTAAGTLKVTYRKEEFRKGEQPENLQSGLKCEWHEAVVNRCHKIDSIPVKEVYVTEDITVPAGVGGKRGLIYSGYLKIEREDIYTFTLGSDDGSMFYIGNEVIVDNDGAHGPVTLTGQKALSTGYHPIKLYYFDMNNGGFIDLKLQDSNGKPIELSKENLYH